MHLAPVAQVGDVPPGKPHRVPDATCALRQLLEVKSSVAGCVKGCRTPTRAGTPSLHADPPRVGVVQASGEETAGSTNLRGLMRGYGDLNGRGVTGGTDSAN